MKVIVTAKGNDPDSAFSPVFGRCPIFVSVDTETMDFEWAVNPALDAGGGAGIQAAQYVVDAGAAAIVTGMVGPNAYRVLAEAGVAVHTFDGGTVRQAVEAFKAGRLPVVTAPSAPAHAGMGAMGGQGMGRGTGGGRGRGQGRGGMGRG